MLRSAISEPCGRPKPYEARVVCGNLTDRVQDPARCCDECGRISGVPQSRFRFLAYSYHTSLTTHSPGQYRAGIHPLPSSSMRRGPPSAYGSHAVTWQGRAPTTENVAALLSWSSGQGPRTSVDRAPALQRSDWVLGSGGAREPPGRRIGSRPVGPAWIGSGAHPANHCLDPARRPRERKLPLDGAR